MRVAGKILPGCKNKAVTGGGAGAAGGAATSGFGGTGGARKSSSISGVSVTYAGGGGEFRTFQRGNKRQFSLFHPASLLG